MSHCMICELFDGKMCTEKHHIKHTAKRVYSIDSDGNETKCIDFDMVDY